MLESKEFIDNYLETYPEIKKYMDDIVDSAYKNGYVTTLLGRKRWIPELKNKNYIIRQQGERIALNTPIQGTNADIIKKAMIEIHKYFKNNNLKSKMTLQVHDELVFELPSEEVEAAIPVIRQVMENAAMPAVAMRVPLQVEARAASNWEEAH